MDQQRVIFNLANEFYGVDIATVEGIIKMQPITAVPHAALVTTVETTFLEGIAKVASGVDRRQRLIILLDLSKVLSVQEQAQLPSPAV